MRDRQRRDGAVALVTAILWFASAAPAQSGVSQRESLDDLLQRAQDAQRSEHYTEAAAAYAQATRLEGAVPELWANRGLMEHLLHQPEAAIESFRRALALKPALFTPLLFSGVDYLALGMPESALPFLTRALRIEPKNADALMASARAYAELKEQRQALHFFQATIDSQPANAAAWYGMATSALAAIEADGWTLARKHAASPWAKALYADELLTQTRVTEATRLYGEAAAQATLQTRKTLLQVLDASLREGWIHLTPETEAKLREAIMAGAPVNGTEGSLMTSACETDDASERNGSAACAFLGGHYEQVAERASGSPNAEGLYWSVKANERRAVLALSRFEELSPQSPVTFDLTGDLYRRRSLGDKARAEYARSLAMDAHDPAALLGTAAAWLADSHPQEALPMALKGLADRAEDPKLNLIAGQALVEQHRFIDAKPFLEKSLALMDHESGGGSADAAAFAHALLGRVAMAEDDTGLAIAELKMGMPSDRDGSLHYQLYRLLRKAGDRAGADAAEAQMRELKAQRFANAAIALENVQERPD